ncbi:hypothetical protein HNR12_002386 [Streptomonospora nanhaiensis]|uniref:Uncharacterized protein n=2 Tax=Streptomonospora nanhaiensis TaxID=1323731 RepID=A0A853BKR8_9ACTN|nr:hypothetical protein [Streptomonospora nanhaiensis]NYI96109.1 hypothetical protein [Streptomonospora nanhaiensis]
MRTSATLAAGHALVAVGKDVLERYGPGGAALRMAEAAQYLRIGYRMLRDSAHSWPPDRRDALVPQVLTDILDLHAWQHTAAAEIGDTGAAHQFRMSAQTLLGAITDTERRAAQGPQGLLLLATALLDRAEATEDAHARYDLAVAAKDLTAEPDDLATTPQEFGRRIALAGATRIWLEASRETGKEVPAALLAKMSEELGDTHSELAASRDVHELAYARAVGLLLREVQTARVAAADVILRAGDQGSVPPSRNGHEAGAGSPEDNRAGLSGLRSSRREQLRQAWELSRTYELTKDSPRLLADSFAYLMALAEGAPPDWDVAEREFAVLPGALRENLPRGDQRPRLAAEALYAMAAERARGHLADGEVAATAARAQRASRRARDLIAVAEHYHAEAGAAPSAAASGAGRPTAQPAGGPLDPAALLAAPPDRAADRAADRRRAELAELRTRVEHLEKGRHAPPGVRRAVAASRKRDGAARGWRARTRGPREPLSGVTADSALPAKGRLGRMSATAAPAARTTPASGPGPPAWAAEAPAVVSGPPVRGAAWRRSPRCGRHQREPPRAAAGRRGGRPVGGAVRGGEHRRTRGSGQRMAEHAEGPRPGDGEPVNHLEGGRLPGEGYPRTEAQWAALGDDLDRRVQYAAELYARGDYLNARQWASDAGFASSAYGDGRLEVYAIEAYLLAGRSAMALGDLYGAYLGLTGVYAQLAEGGGVLPDTERRVLADTVRADLRRLQSRCEEAARTAPTGYAVGHLRSAVEIERLLAAPADRRRLQDLRIELLRRQAEWAGTMPDSPQRARLEDAALRTAADVLDGADLGLAGPELRPVAHTYAALARRRMAQGAFGEEAELKDLADRLRDAVRYLDRGDPPGRPGPQTVEAYLAVRDTAQRYAEGLAGLVLEDTASADDAYAQTRDGAARRAEARERRDLLREAWGISREVEPDPARRAADSYLLLRALADGPENERTEAGEERRNWAEAEELLKNTARELYRHFGAADPRVRDAAEALADMSARRAQNPKAGLAEAAALLRTAEGHQLFATRVEAVAAAGARFGGNGAAGAAAAPAPSAASSARRLEDLRTLRAHLLASKSEVPGRASRPSAAPRPGRGTAKAALTRSRIGGAAPAPDPRLSGRSALRPQWNRPGAAGPRGL